MMRIKPEKMIKVALYIRVSTLEQAEHGYSLQEQEQRLKDYCSAKDWTIKKIYKDGGYSGGSLDRPAMQQLIKDCKKYNMILVYKLDRLSRSQKDTMYLIEDVFLANGVQFTSMSENFDTSTPLGMAMIGILSVFAQLERAQIKERMRMGQTARAKKGLWHGGSNVPLGYLVGDDGKLVASEEAGQIKEIFDLLLSGYNMTKISSIMSAKYPDRLVFRHPSSIQKICSNEIYTGKFTSGNIVIENNHEAIIPQITFQRAQARLNDLKTGAHPFIGTHLLSGFMVCGLCGKHYVSSTTSKGARTWCYYRCASVKSSARKAGEAYCRNRIYKESEVNDLIIQEIKGLSFNAIRKKKHAAKKDYSKEIKSLTDQVNKLVDLYALDGIDFDALSKKIEALNKKKNFLINQQSFENDTQDFDKILSVKGQIDTVFETGTLEDKRRVIDALIKRIVMNEDGIEIEWRF
jgi:site-specific DNA recombinase